MRVGLFLRLPRDIKTLIYHKYMSQVDRAMARIALGTQEHLTEANWIEAASLGYLELITHMPKEHTAVAFLSATEHLDVMKHLLINNDIQHGTIMNVAIVAMINGHLQTLEWLYLGPLKGKQWPFVNDVFKNVIFYGQLPCLKFLVDIYGGMQRIETWVTHYAIWYEQLHILEWMMEEDFISAEEIRTIAIHTEKKAVIDWIDQLIPRATKRVKQ